MSLMNDATGAAVTHADASTPSVAIFYERAASRNCSPELLREDFFFFFNTVYHAAGF